MEFVEPIRDKRKIELVKVILKKNGFRDYMLFLMGINSGLRISDILKLKVYDVRGKRYIEVKEQKTGKHRKFPITESFKAPLKEYITEKSRIGTHTLRKTFGYHFYKEKKDIALMQSILNHSSPSVTLRYIGINQDIIDKNGIEYFLAAEERTILSLDINATVVATGGSVVYSDKSMEHLKKSGKIIECNVGE